MSDRIVDWPAFMRRHDMQFDRVPERWAEAPHFGNAMIGSMLYRTGDTLRLHVFRQDVQDHRDDTFGWTAYSRPRLKIGHFEVKLQGRFIGCSWRKDLWNAELTGLIRTNRGEVHLRHFVHAVDMAIMTELKPAGGESTATWAWHPALAGTTRGGYPTDQASLEKFAQRYGRHYLQTLKPRIANPDGHLSETGGVHLWSQDLHFGGGYATAWAVYERDGLQTHIATIANSFPDRAAPATALSDIQRFIATDREQFTSIHRQWWNDYFRQSFVSIPDTKLESLYWQTVYRMGCTSRAGRFHVDTSGMWFQGESWPYTTNDWNTQASHWGVYSANRLEQGQEVVNRLKRHGNHLIAAVYPEEWRTDSAYLALATAGDLVGTRIGDIRYYDLVGCLPWLLHNAWWQYRYSMDERILRETVFPLLRRAVNLYFHLCEEGPDGRLHLQPTYSPETGVFRDSNFDLALFKWGCHILLQSCRRLKISDPLEPRWRDVIDRLVDFPADERGFKLAADETAPVYHRHLSHLLMMYPLFLANIDQPGRREALVANYLLVHQTRRPADDPIPAELQAMIQTHAAPIGCALGQGDHALEGLRRLVSELSPAGQWPVNEDNPCIESTLSVMSILQDMLIQSWSDPAASEAGPIRIFPALPLDWHDVEFHDLRAEGAFLISAKRTAGKTRWIRIQSLAGEPCLVLLDNDAEFEIHSSRPVEVKKQGSKLYNIDLRKGDSAEFVYDHP